MHRFQNPVHNIQDIILLVGKTCVSRIEGGGEDYFIVMEETGVPGENHRPLTNFITECCLEYTLPEPESNSQC